MSVATYVKPEGTMVDETAIMSKMSLTYMEASLLKAMWLGGTVLNKRSIRQHIYIMRKKLEPHGIVLLTIRSSRYGTSRYGLTPASHDILSRLFS